MIVHIATRRGRGVAAEATVEPPTPRMPGLGEDVGAEPSHDDATSTATTEPIAMSTRTDL
jgi:hypothetical protein